MPLVTAEGMGVSHFGVHEFLQKYKEMRTRLGPTNEDGGSSEGARRAADEGRSRNDRRSAPCSTCKQWLQNNTDPGPNHFIHESFPGLLHNTIVLFHTTESSIL